MTFSNIHRQCGYFSNDKTNSSWQLFITRTRELPGDAVMGGESTPQRRKWLLDAGNSSARKVEKPLSKPGVRLCYTSYIISCRHAVQYTVVFFCPLVTCICNDRYFLSTVPDRSRSLKPFCVTGRNISTQHLATLLLLTRHPDRTSLSVQELIYDIGNISLQDWSPHSSKIKSFTIPILNSVTREANFLPQLH